MTQEEVREYGESFVQFTNQANDTTMLSKKTSGRIMRNKANITEEVNNYDVERHEADNYISGKH